MELLAPAGNFEKLRVAIKYGADALYFAGPSFGLRSGADNFSLRELPTAIAYCHARSVKAYLTLNIFPLPQDIAAFPDFLNQIKNLDLDAVICSDPGIIRLVKKHTAFNIHISTQAGVLNWQQALVYKELGAKRLVLAREVSLTDAAMIKKKANIEIELFIHGAMCSAVSGQCVLSNYENGRDSNRGGCIQNCRHKYRLLHDKQASQDFLLGAKDLNGLYLLEKFKNAGVDSLKIEGRMKSPLYVASVTRAYRKCIDDLGRNSAGNYRYFTSELKKLHHRDYHSGFLTANPKTDSMSDYINSTHQPYAGIVIGTDQLTGEILFLVANNIKRGSIIEFILHDGKNKKIFIENIKDITGQSLTAVKSGRIIKLPASKQLTAEMVARIIPDTAGSSYKQLIAS